MVSEVNILFIDLQSYAWVISLAVSIMSLVISFKNAQRLKHYQYNEFIILIKRAKNEVNLILNKAKKMEKTGKFTDEDSKELESLVNDFFDKINKFNNKIPTKHFAYREDIEELLKYSRIELFLFVNKETLDSAIENLTNIKKYLKNIKV